MASMTSRVAVVFTSPLTPALRRCYTSSERPTKIIQFASENWRAMHVQSRAIRLAIGDCRDAFAQIPTNCSSQIVFSVLSLVVKQNRKYSRLRLSER